MAPGSRRLRPEVTMAHRLCCISTPAGKRWMPGFNLCQRTDIAVPARCNRLANCDSPPLER
jgi:hypothetical protein